MRQYGLLRSVHTDTAIMYVLGITEVGWNGGGGHARQSGKSGGRSGKCAQVVIVSRDGHSADHPGCDVGILRQGCSIGIIRQWPERREPATGCWNQVCPPRKHLLLGAGSAESVTLDTGIASQRREREAPRSFLGVARE